MSIRSGVGFQLLLLCLTARSQTTQSQDSLVQTNVSRPANFIITNAAKVWRFLNISYVRVIDPSVAVAIGPQYATDDFETVEGFGVSFEARIFPWNSALYVATGIAYSHLSEDYFEGCSGPYELTADVTTISVFAGFQWCFGNFAFGVGAGADHYILSAPTGKTRQFSNYDGTLPAARLDLGYGW